MDFGVTIEIEGARSEPADVGRLRHLAEHVMEGEGCVPGTSLAILLTGDAQVRDLNQRFLGLDEPTDVLAFPEEDDGDFVVGEESETHLGDVAISLDTAVRQAADLGHGLDDELAHLLVHGILHLRGYDHALGPEEERLMREREEHYLGAITGHDH